MFRQLLFRALSTFLAVVLAAAVASATQQVVRTGPLPEIRTLIDACLKALNSGSADDWEAFAKERFSPDLLNKRPAADRKQLFERIRGDLGTLTLDSVRRRGPDAPLELNVKGSNGMTGVIGLELDAASPPRIVNLTVNVGSKDAPPAADGVPAPPVNRSMTGDELNRSLDGYFSKLTAADVFSGVALVAKNGVPVFYKAYGLADRGNKIPNTLRTRFNIGSINKTFTQVAIGQLIREGKLAATDTLGKFFPDYPQELSRTATVEQLLNHKAGLADFFGPEFSRTAKDGFRSNADYFRFVGTLAPAFAPGARNQYCNGCYIALGAIVERVSGMPYEQYVDEQIFRRAEMTSTGYPHTDDVEPDIALGYTRRGSGVSAKAGATGSATAGGSLRSNVFLHGATGSAAGGGYSTAMDLLLYVKAVRAGRFPGAEPNMGIAGGAPGTSAVVEAGPEWTVIVLSNLDPPTGEQIGVAIMEALRR
jgi:CubicO group peptidase (beta-lactamase class C family)